MSEERFTVDVGDDPGPIPGRRLSHLERAREELDATVPDEDTPRIPNYGRGATGACPRHWPTPDDACPACGDAS